jgi:DNA-binding beta-propeller fold protein YncE
MLNKQAERYSDKPICDGISIDKDNNIYVTDIANNAVGVIDITGKYRILYRDEKLSWPDAFSFGPDGKLYTVANQLHKSAMLNGGKTTARPPFLVFRLDPLTTGQPGR